MDESRKNSEIALCSPVNHCLTWKNLCYTVKRRKNGGYFSDLLRGRQMENIEILHNISGIAQSGSLMAILGPSGAGKTTFLATISRRLKGNASGDVLLDGKLIDRKVMSRISGFVAQDDLAVESLTVQEHMEFMARMKMDRRHSRISRAQKINNLLSDLSLNASKRTKLSDLSGGERKRVSVAVQLLTEPNILFCDEPTTGLDSYSARIVIKILRELSASGRMVICSLHQPASGLLDFFHEVILLAAGKIAFQGPSILATRFFSSLGLDCPAAFNPAEFFVSQLSIVRGNEAESEKKINFICKEFKKSSEGRQIEKLIEKSLECVDRQLKRGVFKAESFLLLENGFKKIPPFTQLLWLIWRSFIDYRRNFSVIFFRFCLYMFIGLLLAVPYIGLTDDIDQNGIQNMQGLIYLVVTETVFTFNYAVFHTFPKELPLLLRDMASGLYYPAPYYVSKIAVLIPGSVVQPFLYAALIYCVAGLKGGFSGFLLFSIPVIFCATSAAAVGCLMSAAFQSIETASLFSVPIDFLGLIFSGVYLHLGNLPPTISWLKYMSQFYFSAEAVSLMQWQQYDRINCPKDPQEPCISSGQGVLEKYGFIPGNYCIDLIGLFGIFFVGHFAGFLAIRYRSQKEAVY